MHRLSSNGIQLAYECSGRGENVLLIMGSGAGGRVWTVHQTPALHRAGYRTTTFDHRGMAPSDAPAGKYSLDDLVSDTVGLIDGLDLAPCRVVGFSLGAVVAQELLMAYPELVRGAVLMATRARSDAYRRAQTRAEQALAESAVSIPAPHRALTTASQMLSPATLNDDVSATMWMDLLEMSGADASGGQAWVDLDIDRRAALRSITAPCRVIAFSDDQISPPHLAAEVAEAIPRCDLVEIAHAGHLGHLEQPQLVNEAIVEFLATC